MLNLSVILELHRVHGCNRTSFTSRKQQLYVGFFIVCPSGKEEQSSMKRVSGHIKTFKNNYDFKIN